ncbi:MAG: O-methyltransferase [Acidimicrobiales bacterium]
MSEQTSREQAKQLWSDVDGYVSSLHGGPDPALEAALEASAAAGLPPINVAANQGKLLHLLARATGARKILEVGTLGGYSTIWLARALPEGGSLLTLEANPLHAKVATESISRAGLAHLVEVRLGLATETLAKLASEGAGGFDLVFIDADKANYPSYLSSALELAAPGALLVADNVVRQGAVLDATGGDADLRGIRRFHELLGADPRVDATVVQTVGTKGYDGFALGIVAGSGAR